LWCSSPPGTERIVLDILAIEPDSIAAELGLCAGDRLLALNGEPVRDLLDYQLQVQVEELLVEVERADGELWEIEIAKTADEPLGLRLPHPEPEQCGNNCIFCFVHQLPPGMRQSLYVKDEDYRFSYLYGAYVTLTNLDEQSLQRILNQRLTPLYVSVHATEEQLREHLLGRRGPAILAQLRQLVAGGITVHAQVVICPGVNDGVELERTFRDLVALAPAAAELAAPRAALASLAIVPVGLTGYRQRLPQLRPVSPAEARTLVAWVQDRQAECLATIGSRFVYAADELYLNAGVDFPPLAEYEGLPQLENGVGLVARFRAQAEEVLAQAGPLDLPSVSIITGIASAGEIRSFCAALGSRTGVAIEVVAVPNRFFGGAVSVTGLLTGRDITEELSGRKLGEVLLLPDVLLREGTEILLDDLTITELERRLGVVIEVFPAEPWGLWDILETLTLERDGKE
jgi:putative radical SAM enzyme (TIGR03279 family)